MSSTEKDESTANGGAGGEPPAKKKRTADRQITKDDTDLDAEGGGEDTVNGSFKKADNATLQKRRIVRAKRPVQSAASSSGSQSSSSNPFANTVLVATDSKVSSTTTSSTGSKVFGSGASFGGFGAAASASSKADDGKSSTTTTAGGFGSSGSGFGSSSGFKGFGTVPKSTGGFGGFGSAAASTTNNGGTTKNLFEVKPGSVPTFGFGSSTTTASTTTDNKKEGEDADSKSETSPNASPVKPAVKLPDQVDLTTGEEKEKKIFEHRCKTHVQVPNTADDKDKESTASAPAAPSVPPSASSFAKLKESESAAGSPSRRKADWSSSSSATAAAAATTAENKKVWKEVGVGPLKVLEGGPNKFRLVQRYQGKNTGDQPTKVILNIPYWKETKVFKPGEKYVQLTGIFPSDGLAGSMIQTTFSFKFKLEEEAQRLHDLLKSKRDDAASLDEKKSSGDNDNAAKKVEAN